MRARLIPRGLYVSSARMILSAQSPLTQIVRRSRSNISQTSVFACQKSSGYRVNQKSNPSIRLEQKQNLSRELEGPKLNAPCRSELHTFIRICERRIESVFSRWRRKFFCRMVITKNSDDSRQAKPRRQKTSSETASALAARSY